MNFTIGDREWTVMWYWRGWALARGIYPFRHPCAVFRWWTFGPIHVRRFYFPGEYGRLHPTTTDA